MFSTPGSLQRHYKNGCRTEAERKAVRAKARWCLHCRKEFSRPFTLKRHVARGCPALKALPEEDREEEVRLAQIVEKQWEELEERDEALEERDEELEGCGRELEKLEKQNKQLEDELKLLRSQGGGAAGGAGAAAGGAAGGAGAAAGGTGMFPYDGVRKLTGVGVAVGEEAGAPDEKATPTNIASQGTGNAVGSGNTVDNSQTTVNLNVYGSECFDLKKHPEVLEKIVTQAIHAIQGQQPSEHIRDRILENAVRELGRLPENRTLMGYDGGTDQVGVHVANGVWDHKRPADVAGDYVERLQKTTWDADPRLRQGRLEGEERKDWIRRRGTPAVQGVAQLNALDASGDKSAKPDVVGL